MSHNCLSLLFQGIWLHMIHIISCRDTHREHTGIHTAKWLMFVHVFMLVCFSPPYFHCAFLNFAPLPTTMVQLSLSYPFTLSSVILILFLNYLFEAVVTHIHRRWGLVTHINRYAIQSFVLVTSRNALKQCGEQSSLLRSQLCRGTGNGLLRNWWRENAEIHLQPRFWSVWLGNSSILKPNGFSYSCDLGYDF